MKIACDGFGHFYNQPVRKIRLENDHGMSVEILELGGIITSLLVPDNKGDIADIVLGFDDLPSYVRDRHYFGALIGRVANRVEGAQFRLNGETVRVDANAHEARHCVHGGRFGYHRRVWRLLSSQEMADSVAITLGLLDGDGEEGFPHSVDVTARYHLDNDNCLSLTFEAAADGLTPINLTAHSYFNLLGHDTGSIADHRLDIFADHGLEQGADRVPTGRLLPLSDMGLALDGRYSLREMVDQGLAFNHSYIPDRSLTSQPIATRRMARLEAGGRALEIWSNELTLHFYNGHNLDGVRGKDGAIYPPFSGLCLEPKGYVNAINQPAFPARLIDQNTRYQHRIEYQFSPGNRA
ncbi:aldose epimerase family protein [Cohaesibacter intestini]|uniref:aldose epimerase family protein n=1 Tax=Cohaesibacter intestini TaxID=2211145 RepID=UPI000DEA3A94|nr:aldose epimerase family protein [Cohaesibacter intestini]